MHPLRTLRRQRGMSMAWLAKRAGVHRGTVSDIERYRTQPYLPTRRYLLGALGVPMEEHERVFGPRARNGGTHGTEGQ